MHNVLITPFLYSKNKNKKTILVLSVCQAESWVLGRTVTNELDTRSALTELTDQRGQEMLN